MEAKRGLFLVAVVVQLGGLLTPGTISAQDGQEPSASVATPKRHWGTELARPTATAAANEAELLAGVSAKSFALLGGDRLGTLINCSLTDPNRPGGVHSVGYYLVMPMSKGDEARPDHELLGPLWDLPNLRGEHVEGKLAYDIKVALCHPMESLSGRSWGWYTTSQPGGYIRTPLVYSLLYYDLQDQRGLIRWEHQGEPSDHRLKRSVLDTVKRKWSAAGIVDPGDNMQWDNWLAPGRYSLRAETQLGGVRRIARCISIYDKVEDRFVDDPWLRDLLLDIAGQQWLAGRFIITSDRNWLIAAPVTSYETDDKRDSPPAEVAYSEIRFQRLKEYLVFHRGDAKPTVSRAIDKASQPAPNNAFADDKGELQLLYETGGGTILVPFKGGNRQSCQYRLGTRGKIATEHSMIIDIFAKTRTGFVHEGTKLACTINIIRWSYLGGSCKVTTVHLDDLFEVHGRRVVPGRLKALPIAEHP